MLTERSLQQSSQEIPKIALALVKDDFSLVLKEHIFENPRNYSDPYFISALMQSIRRVHLSGADVVKLVEILSILPDEAKTCIANDPVSHFTVCTLLNHTKNLLAYFLTHDTVVSSAELINPGFTEGLKKIEKNVGIMLDYYYEQGTPNARYNGMLNFENYPLYILPMGNSDVSIVSEPNRKTLLYMENEMYLIRDLIHGCEYKQAYKEAQILIKHLETERQTSLDINRNLAICYSLLAVASNNPEESMALVEKSLVELFLYFDADEASIMYAFDNLTKVCADTNLLEFFIKCNNHIANIALADTDIEKKVAATDYAEFLDSRICEQAVGRFITIDSWAYYLREKFYINPEEIPFSEDALNPSDTL